MKNILRKLCAGSVAAAMACSLAACAPKEGGTATPSAEPTWSAEQLPDDVAFLPENETDVAEKFLGFSKDTVLLKVNGTEVTAEDYLYWLGNMTSYYEMMMAYSGSMFNLDDPISDGGVTWDEQMKETAYQNCILLTVAPKVAATYGVTLDETDLEEVKSQRQSRIDSAGSETEYARQLQAMGISDRSAYRLDQQAALFSKVQEVYLEKVQTEGDPESITAEEMAAYVEEEGLLRAKHILLLTQDMNTGEQFDDARKAEQKAKAEEILAQLREDPTQFDTLMNENSEDTGLSSYPDGYLFGPGEMVSEFEEGTRALEVGAISEIIESSYGYHIILRLDADCDESREEYAMEKFNRMMDEWVTSATVEKMPEYDTFTTKDYYTPLVEFQAQLQEAVTEDQSDASLEPLPTDAPQVDSEETPTEAE